MKIGYNKNNGKKQYQKPVLEVIAIDQAIVMTIGNSGIPDDPSSSSTAPNAGNNTLSKKTVFPQSDNPFGGSAPDYER